MLPSDRVPAIGDAPRTGRHAPGVRGERPRRHPAARLPATGSACRPARSPGTPSAPSRFQPDDPSASIVAIRMSAAIRTSADRRQGRWLARNPGRTAGLWYLLLILAGPLPLIYVPGRLVLDGDAAATAGNIGAHEWLFRSGMADGLVIGLILIFLVMAFYRLFKEVDRNLAALVVVLGGVMPATIHVINTVGDAGARCSPYATRACSPRSANRNGTPRRCCSFACTPGNTRPPRCCKARGFFRRQCSSAGPASCRAFSASGSRSTGGPRACQLRGSAAAALPGEGLRDLRPLVSGNRRSCSGS